MILHHLEICYMNEHGDILPYILHHLEICYMNESGDILPYTPMKKIFNLRWYVQHVMDESEDEAQNPLSEENWMKQNNCKFNKCVIHNRHPMTPEQLK